VIKIKLLKAPADNTVERKTCGTAAMTLSMLLFLLNSQQEVVEKTMPFIRPLLIVCMASTFHRHDLTVWHVAEITNRL